MLEASVAAFSAVGITVCFAVVVAKLVHPDRE
jgi:hypothetical protein